MTTESSEILISGLTVEVVRKPIKNLHVGVYPPNGRVRVAAPEAVSDEAIRLAVISRLGWIKKQQAKFEGQARESPREMVSGESHYFLGQRYRLEVIESPLKPRVEVIKKSVIGIHARPGMGVGQRERLLHRWYREQLKEVVPPLLEKWQTILGVAPSDWGVRRMKTKWGSCSAKDRRIWLNLELAKKSPHCLEYVVAHEMVHLVERKHGDRFETLMDRHLPQWRLYREELNAAPLGHSDWGSSNGS